MNCVVHSSSTIARRTTEAGVVAPYNGHCTGNATYEVMEAGEWRPLCVIHADVYQTNYPDNEFREIIYLIDEEPELV